MEHQHQTQSEALDRLLHLLTDQYSRSVLSHFRTTSTDVASVGDLANELAAPDRDDADRIAVRLHHRILPKLAEVGVAEYDERSRTVRYVGCGEFEPLVGVVLDQYSIRRADE